MPGFIPHFIAGNAMFLLGSYYIQNYTQLPYTTTNKTLLYLICITSSILPDFPLALYYSLQVGSFETLVKPHALLHYIISPLAVVFFIGLDVVYPVKKRPLWIMGILCIILHIFMDSILSETGIWI